MKGKDLFPYTRIRRPLGHHILSIDAFDLEGDGENEILVTDLLDESVQSVVFKKKGDVYEEVAEGIRYYLVVLPDWKGKPTLVGQYQGVETPFRGKIVTLRWDGKQLVPGETLPHDTTIAPLWSGVLGLSSGRFGNEWRLIYTDEEANASGFSMRRGNRPSSPAPGTERAWITSSGDLSSRSKGAGIGSR